MKTPVSIRVDSRQTDPDGRIDNISASYEGMMFHKDDVWVLSYDEASDAGLVKCMIKIYDDRIELSKKGKLSYNMFFKEGVRKPVSYGTVYGIVPMVAETSSIDIMRDIGTGISAEIQYNLDMGGGYVLKCGMRLNAEPTEDDRV